MANPEHLKILRQGIKAWNKWRSDNSGIQPDLSNTNLSRGNLSKANLRMANLEDANFTMANLSEAMLEGAFLRMAFLGKAKLNRATLSKAYLAGALLKEADLSGADLNGANLEGANLEGAYIIDADLSGANLSGANLSGAYITGTNFSGIIWIKADLSGADLSGLTLRGANLYEADLSGGNCSKADLSGADLARANLKRANLREAILAGANLIRADLDKARLSGANLNGAHLTGASLMGAKLNGADMRGIRLDVAMLIGAKLDGANLTEAHLWETQRAEWSIKGVICESAYWDGRGKDKIIYNPGEFERLFSEKTKVKLFYKGGIRPLEIATLPALIKHLERSHPGSSLRLVNVREDAGGAVVELAIEDAGNQSPKQLKQLEAEAQQKAQYLRQVLDEVLQLKGQVQAYERVVGQLLSNQKPTFYLEKGNIQMGSTYNVNQAGAVGDNANAHDMTFNQIVNQFEKSVDLPALANQLEELRQEMAKRQDLSPQAAIALGEAAKAEIEAKKGNTSKVVEYLKAGGQGLLDILKEAGKEGLISVIKAAMGMQ